MWCGLAAKKFCGRTRDAEHVAEDARVGLRVHEREHAAAARRGGARAEEVGVAVDAEVARVGLLVEARHHDCVAPDVVHLEGVYNVREHGERVPAGEPLARAWLVVAVARSRRKRERDRSPLLQPSFTNSSWSKRAVTLRCALWSTSRGMSQLYATSKKSAERSVVCARGESDRDGRVTLVVARRSQGRMRAKMPRFSY